MRLAGFKYTVLVWVSILSLIIFMLIPFQGFLTVWVSSIVGHYTAVRLWDEYILFLCILGIIYLYITDNKIRFNTLSRRIVWLILAYLLINIIWGTIAYIKGSVTAKALGFGLIVNLRFLLFFLVTWVCALRLTKMRKHWQWLVIYPSILVVVFGLVQVFFLPVDFMKHFGYGPHTIPVSATINSNSHYHRYASTTRGPNPLGAYLIIPISLLTVLLIKPRRNYRQALLLSGALVLLFFTYSRSAWIGAALSLIIILLSVRGSPKFNKYAAIILSCIAVASIGVVLIFRHSPVFQNYVLHTQSNSAIKSTSNANHTSYIKQGVKTIVHNPLGSGPGTSGPASIYNGSKSRTVENYYLQIGEETGIIGLSVFILINVGVGYLLWLRRGDTLSFSLFAALIAISVVNLVEPAWTDDTLSYIWWGLAGVAMAPDIRLKYKKAEEL